MTEMQKIYHNIQVGGLCYIPERSVNGFNTFIDCGIVTEIDGDNVTVKRSVFDPELYGRMKGGYKDIYDVFNIFDVFTYSKDGRELCEQKFGERWFDFLCHGCDCYHRADQGYEPNCARCAHVQKKTDGLKSYGVCDKCGFEMRVTEEYHPNGAHFCKHFEPKWPQDKPIYQDFDSWMEHQRVCEHNRECPFHKNSAWKTRDYETWLNELVHLGVHAHYHGREVREIAFPRKNRINADFYLGNGKFVCSMVRYSPKLNQNGTLKKGESWNDWAECPEGFIVVDEV